MEDRNTPEAIKARSEQVDPIVMYLVVREDLGMSIGKTAAQCAHASQMLLMKYLDERNRTIGLPTVIDLETNILVEDFAKTKLWHIMEEWLKSSFRKVVLKADIKEWEKLKTEISEDERIIVVDAGLTEIPSGSETVMGIFPMHKSSAPKVIKKLQVLK